MISLCFVCLGNICRSPTAEGVMIHLVEQAGLADQIRVDSAGTAAYHLGNRPDSRSLRAARNRGVDLPGRARQFQSQDFAHFDYVLCMDTSNLSNVLALADSGSGHQVHLLLDFDPHSPPGSSVPDPYYGGESGFETVLDLCFRACQGLLDHLRKAHSL